MGDIVRAHCHCGYSKEIFVGGGMLNFTTYCNFPSYCNDCKDLIEVNLFDTNILCPKCNGLNIVAYDDDHICKEKATVISSWDTEEKLGRELVLTDGKYLCPKCNSFSLSFEDAGYWD